MLRSSLITQFPRPPRKKQAPQQAHDTILARLFNEAVQRVLIVHTGSVAIESLTEVRPRKDKRGVDLISEVLPLGRLWYDTPDNAIGYAMHCSRSHDAVIRVYDEAG